MNLEPSEKNIQAAIIEYLTRRRVFHYRNNSGAMKKDDYFVRFGAEGSPDIVCVLFGRYVGIEVKTEKGKQSESQKEFQRKLEDSYGIYFLVRSVDQAIEAIEDAISRLGRNPQRP